MPRETRRDPSNKVHFVIFALMIGCVLGLLGGELLLRSRYNSLPSLAPLESGSYKLQVFSWPDKSPDLTAWRSEFCPDHALLVKGQSKDFAEVQVLGGGPSALLRMTIAGDSVAQGAGVRFRGSYGFHLGTRISKELQRPVEVRNTGMPGANFCDVLRINYGYLDSHATPDVLVLELFADDLEHRATLMVGDELVLLPDRVQSTIGRALVSRSYVVNLGWLAIAPRVHQMPKRMVRPIDQRRFQQALADFITAMAERGSTVVTMLLPPAGMPLCPDKPADNSRCIWLKEDLNLMARLMADKKIPFVDLRTFWDKHPVDLIPWELAAVKSGRMDLGIHPYYEGHKRIAAALLEPTLKALQQSQRSKMASSEDKR